MDRQTSKEGDNATEDQIEQLIKAMSLEDKIGQLQQVDASGNHLSDWLIDAVRAGRIGSVLNQVDPGLCDELQRLAREESPHGIPLLIGRDVIHGFQTVFPIPIAQAASWNPQLIEACAHYAAKEASAHGVNWTFSPMIDISRDARWGRIAESFGEDPYLTGLLGAAMIEGYQGQDLSSSDRIAACAKHFVGYGASESGRDYDATNIPPNELRNTYLPPFKDAVDAGAATFMTSFGDIDGIPASGNKEMLQHVLRDDWGFEGLVVSDWDSVRQLTVHGLTEGDRDAALQAADAGVDMEMAGDAFAGNLAALVHAGEIEMRKIDEMVRRVLLLKQKLGLFDAGKRLASQTAQPDLQEGFDLAYQAAVEGSVLLKNEHCILPLDQDQLMRVALIGPMADQPYEQLGTWIFDGDDSRSVTPYQALRAALPKAKIDFVPAMASTRSKDTSGFEEALVAAREADCVIVCVGEDAILSGEAHSRADIDLPGAQGELISRLKSTGKPVIVVVLAGRPLTLQSVLDDCNALLFAWHPGTMAGPAIIDLLLGKVDPVGRLPVSLPRMVGQIPIHYNRKNTGRPPSPNEVVHIDDIETGAKQTSLGMTSFHLDAGHTPLFPFGFGLAFTHFSMWDLYLSADTMHMDDTLIAGLHMKNEGARRGSQTVQLFIRDIAASLTRPVRELKAFQRITLKPGEIHHVQFELTTEHLAFNRRDGTFGPEPGEFEVWAGADAHAHLCARFRLVS
ncbi:MAG: glycoside hydrolase family 3 N-terminal domain-containing protein [Pseudomonadota bacterium]